MRAGLVGMKWCPGVPAVVAAGVVLLAAGVSVAAEESAPCCFSNERYAGTCTVVPGKGESCESILAYLNDPLSSGKAYCKNTSVRGGWEQVECESATPAPQEGDAAAALPSSTRAAEGATTAP